MSDRSAFTLVEVLVVIVIIMVLAGLSMVGLGVMRNQQRKAQTLQLLEHLEDALGAYLDRYGRFGDASHDDFAAEPWLYLHRRPIDSGEEPYLRLPRHQVLGPSGAPVDPKQAVLIGDGWGLPLRWNRASADPHGPDAEGFQPRRHARYIRVSSSVGTENDPTDDLVSELDLTASGNERWERKRGYD